MSKDLSIVIIEVFRVSALDELLHDRHVGAVKHFQHEHTVLALQHPGFDPFVEHIEEEKVKFFWTCSWVTSVMNGDELNCSMNRNS